MDVDEHTPEEQVYHREVVLCRHHSLRPVEQITLQPFFQHAAVLRGVYEKEASIERLKSCYELWGSLQVPFQ